MRHLVTTALCCVIALPACGSKSQDGATDGGTGGTPTPASTVDVGLTAGYAATVVLDGLMNPSHVSFAPGGELTVCDSGNGQVLMVTNGVATPYLTGFTTEYWKVDAEKNISRFKLGPLCAVWMGSTLAVSDAGLGDGAEVIRFFDQAGDVNAAPATNAVPPTSQDPADKGEGNLCGFALAADGDTLWVCGQGADAKSWVLKAQKSTKTLGPAFSADDNGIAVNSPMQALVWDTTKLLVIYSGAGGKEDGLIVEWDTATAKPSRQWTLPGLIDPMGMARIPGTDELVICDNNWALTQVNEGRLARVTLPAEGGAAAVTVIGTRLRGPVHCAFGPDKRLYIAQLGPEFDKGQGQVLAISGF